MQVLTTYSMASETNMLSDNHASGSVIGGPSFSRIVLLLVPDLSKECEDTYRCVVRLRLLCALCLNGIVLVSRQQQTCL